MSEFKRIACWNPGEIEHFIRREALEGDPAAFLAVHFPIRNFQLMIGQLPEPTDEALLTALSAAHPHAIAMVEGEPGSGKSHLIQWLRFKWPKGDFDKVVLVPRSDGSLTGALERLRIELGHRYAEPLEGLGAASQLTEAGHTNQFIGNLVTSAQGSNYSDDRRPKLADWLDERDAWRVLNHSALREHWRAPADLIRIIKGAEGKRDQAAAEFTPEHILELVSIIRGAPVRTVGSFRAERFFGDLEKEARQVRNAVQDAANVERQVEALQGTAPTTVKFIEALNARIADALQGTLGIQRGELQRKFLEVRKLLRADERRLVLLLEDVTNLQGVDQQLIEALLPNPNVDANRSLCELVAVIGVTPQYQSQVFEGLGNLQDRLTFHIRLTPVEGRGVVGAQSLFLSDADRRQRFVSSYLNAVRLGLDEVRNWQVEGSQRPRPNACDRDRCRHRDECFSRFGSIVVSNVGTTLGESVGLYPFTARAIERFWSRLEDPARLRSLKTPRGLLMNVVSGVLADAEALKNGRFPSSSVEGTNLRRDGASADVVERCSRLGEDEGARLSRAIQSWGDLNDGRKKSQTGAEPTFSGIPQGVAFAFDLKWPGEEIEKPSVAVRTEEPQVEVKHELVQEPKVPSLPARSFLPADWVENIEDLNRWLSGGRLRNASAWESLLFEAISALDPGTLGAAKGLWETVMTAENVTLAGAKGRTTQLTFELERTPPVARGLTALAWLKKGKDLRPKELMHRFAEASIFQSLLRREALKHFARCEKRLSDDCGGHPIDLAVKSLVLVAMLDGKVQPSDRPVEAWRSVFKSIQTRRGGRCRDWETLAQRLSPERDALALNAVLLTRVGAGRPGPKLEGIVDGCRVLASVQDALQLPASWGLRRKEALKRDAWATALQVADELRDGFQAAVAAEYSDITQRCTKLDAATGGKDSEQFLSTAENVIDACLKAKSELISQPVQQKWRTARAELRSEQLDPKSARLRALDDAILNFGHGNEGDEVRKKLELVLSVPKADLVLVEQAVTAAATGIVEAHDRIVEWKGETTGPVSGMTELSKAAALMERACKALKEAHPGSRA